MIVAEHSIRDIVAGMPALRINRDFAQKPSFHWGDEIELNRYIKQKQEAAYPLIWLLPSDDEFKNKGTKFQSLEKECSFILATREVRKELFNHERYVRSYDVVLNPLQDWLIKGLTQSNITEHLGDGFTSFKVPNYSADSEENGTIDIWDAIRLDIRVRFKDNRTCLKPINYGN